MLGMTGEQVQALENADDDREALEAAISTKYFSRPVQVTLCAKLESYNGESRSNITCVEAKELSCGEYGRALVKEISERLTRKSHMLGMAGSVLQTLKQSCLTLHCTVAQQLFII